MTEKQFKVTNISENGNTGLFWLGKDNLSVYDVARLLNELNEENKELNLQLNRFKAYILKYTNIDYEELDGIAEDERLSDWWEDIE